MDSTSKDHFNLYLSGGGIKAAAFHAGACIALRDRGFHFLGGNKDDVAKQIENLSTGDKRIDTYVGASSGSLISSYFATGHTVEALIDSFDLQGMFDLYSKNQMKLPKISYSHLFSLGSKRYFYSMLKTLPFIKRKINGLGGMELFVKNQFRFSGLFSTDKLEAFLEEAIFKQINDFHQLGAELHIVATELDRGRKTVFCNTENTFERNGVLYTSSAKISEAICGSIAVPLIFQPKKITAEDGSSTYYYDGDLRDALSYDIPLKPKNLTTITSYLCQPYKYDESVGSLFDLGVPVIIQQAIYQIFQSRIRAKTSNLTKIQDLYASVEEYCKQKNLSAETKDDLLNLIWKTSNVKRNFKSINIHPDPQDFSTFFSDHFSFNKKLLSRVVKVGFRSAIKALREAELD